MAPTSRANSTRRRGCAAQSSKSAGAASVATPSTRASPAAAQTASAPPVPKPATQTPATSGRASSRSTAEVRSASHPPNEKSPGEAPHPRKAKLKHGPALGGAQAIGQRRQGDVGERGPADDLREAVAQHQAGPQHASRSAAGPGARTARSAANRSGPAVAPRRSTSAGLGRPLTLPQPVATVARLGQGVRPEADEAFGFQQLAEQLRRPPRQARRRRRRPGCACRPGSGCARSGSVVPRRQYGRKRAMGMAQRAIPIVTKLEKHRSAAVAPGGTSPGWPTCGCLAGSRQVVQRPN